MIRNLTKFGVHLNGPVDTLIHVVEQLLIVGELLVEFRGGIVAEIVAELHQQNVRLVQRRFLAVLIQEHRGPCLHVLLVDGNRRYPPRTADRSLIPRTDTIFKLLMLVTSITTYYES